MKKYLIAAAVAAMPMLASTSAHAITVPANEQLTISIGGQYATESGPLGIGSVLTLSNVTVSNILEDGSNIDWDGLTLGSPVTVGGTFTFSDGSDNAGLTFDFDTGSSATFTMGQTAGAGFFTPPFGLTQGSVAGLGTFTNQEINDASFGFSTSSTGRTGGFTLAVTTPPELELPPEEPNVIPLPAAAWMLLAGLGSLWAFRRRTHA